MNILPPLLGLLIGVAMGGASAGVAAAEAGGTASSSIDIRLRGSAAEAHTVNRSFVFDSRWRFGGEGPVRLMLEIATDVTQRDDAEGFAVRQSGCYGARDSFTIFNLYSGTRLFSATGDSASRCWAVLEVPNSGGLERLVAFHAAYSATDDKAFGRRRDVVGLLTYAAADRPLARYRLVATGRSVDSFMGEAAVTLQQNGRDEESRSLTLWPADGRKDAKAIGGFRIRLQLTPEKAASIPVEGDRLGIAAADLPPGLRIEPVPLP